MPLLKSSTRFDPVLYKDAVSNARKKYRKIELVPISTGNQAAAANNNNVAAAASEAKAAAIAQPPKKWKFIQKKKIILLTDKDLDCFF
jgi:hypothetical protein